MRKMRCAISLVLSLALVLQIAAPAAHAADAAGSYAQERTLEDIMADLYTYYNVSSDEGAGFDKDAPASDPETEAAEPVILLSGGSDDAALPGIVSNEATDFQYNILDETHCAVTGYTGSAEEVVIPAEIDGYSVRRISQNAFSSNDTITGVTIPEGVEEIRFYAFYDCASLETVTLPDSLAAIGYEAFGYCTALRSINYPKELTSIPGNATTYQSGSIFVGCESLEQIKVPEGVTALPDGVFKGCDALQSVILPSTLTAIGNDAFALSGITSITIPDSVTDIGNAAFRDCESLETVQMGNALSSLGSSAFQYCTALSAIQLPDTLTAIEETTFSGCSELEDVTLPSRLTKIAASAFQDCVSLKTLLLPDRLTSIGTDAFAASGLTSITIPDSVTDIGNAAFSGCMDLQSVTLPSALCSISDECFLECASLSNISFPRELQTIGKYAFCDCTSLGFISLPDCITSISGSAFSGCTNLELTRLPSALTSIDGYAFCECEKLSRVRVPNSVTQIDDWAFSDTPNLEFLCSSYSYAAVYAIDHDIPMIDTGEPAPAHPIIDRSATSYKLSGNGLSSAGTLNMVASCAFNQSKTCTDVELRFNLPDSLYLIENSLTVDGVLCTDYALTDTTLTVPVQNSGGTVRFQFEPNSYDPFTAHCQTTFRCNGASYTEIIGSVYAELPTLTLSAPTETTKTTVNVTGVTTPENEVTLAVNGRNPMTVTANKAGNYTANVSLGDAQPGEHFTITALAKTDPGLLLSASAETTYDDHAVELIHFEMTYGDNTYNLLNSNRPTLVWDPEETFGFEVRLSNYDDVVSVFISSSHNNVKKFMKTTWDSSKQAYVAHGWFENTDGSYIPSNVGVEVVRNNGSISFQGGMDLLMSGYELPEEWKGSDCTVNHSDENSSDYYIDIPDQGDEDYALRYQTSISTKANYTEADAIADGYTPVTDENGKTVYTRESMTPTGMRVSTIDFSNAGGSLAQVTDILIDCYTVNIESGKKVFAPLSSVDTTMDIVGILASTLDTVNDFIEIDKIQTGIMHSDLSEAEKDAAMAKVHQAQTVNTISQLMRIGVTIASASLVVPGLGAWGIVAAAALLIANEAIDMFDEFFMQELYSASLKWLIDPSGYIYDLETGQRIHGATVTVFWIPCEEADEEYWSNKPAEDEYGTPWNAAEYSLYNPQTTDKEGRYGWDVPEGWWRVRCEMAGYETVWSQWLPVPPPQLEVNLGMSGPAPALALDLTGHTAASASVVLTNNRYSGDAAQMILAAYDGSGKMVAVETVEGIPSIGETRDLSVSCSAKDTIQNLKLFVLNDDLQPDISPLQKSVPNH